MTASTTRPERPADHRPGVNGTHTRVSGAHTHQVGPSTAGSVVLDIGSTVGALVVITGPEWHGREIEISPLGQDPAVRTHVAVRERRLADGLRYAAVFASLPAGPYTLWRNPKEQAGTVVVAPATVTELEWWVRP